MSIAEEKVIQLGASLATIFENYFGKGNNPFVSIIQNPKKIVSLLLSYEKDLEATPDGLKSFISKLDFPTSFENQMQTIEQFLSRNRENLQQLFDILNKIRRLAQKNNGS